MAGKGLFNLIRLLDRVYLRANQQIHTLESQVVLVVDVLELLVLGELLEGLGCTVLLLRDFAKGALKPV